MEGKQAGTGVDGRLWNSRRGEVRALCSNLKSKEVSGDPRSVVYSQERITRTASFPVLSVLDAQMIPAKVSGEVCYTQQLCTNMSPVEGGSRQQTCLGRGQRRGLQPFLGVRVAILVLYLENS